MAEPQPNEEPAATPPVEAVTEPPVWRNPLLLMLYIAAIAAVVTGFFAHRRVPHLAGKHITNLYLIELITGWAALGAIYVWPFRTRMRRRFHPPTYEPAPLRLAIAAEVVVVLAVAATIGWTVGAYGHP